MNSIPEAADRVSEVRAGVVVPEPPASTRVSPDSLYGDDVWDLTALSGRPTARWLTVDVTRAPARMRSDFKRFLYLVLTVDTPLERLERATAMRVRPTPTTVKTLWEDLTPFFKWVKDTKAGAISDLTDQDLREYATSVQAEAVTQPTRGRRLMALSRLWLFAPYLPPSARLVQPYWEREGLDQVLGPSEWTPDNKTAPIHPATMSALLVWCLRVLEDAPELARRHSLKPHPVPGSARPLVWVDPPTGGLAHSSRRLVTSAALVVTAYLTGMRADEVISLERGCCSPSPGRPGSFDITGRTFKAAVRDGRSIGEGQQREHPWVAIKPVADAISVMEDLHPHQRLFPAAMLKRGQRLPFTNVAPLSNARAEAITALITWANKRAGDLDRAHEMIPEDPEGQISMRRLRRTLAWFVYRRPRGRVALGIQYGHLHAATTDGYGTRVSAGLRDLFPMEEALALSDTLSDAAQQLQSHTTVSGPAAERYKSAAQKYTHRFAGLTLTARQAADLAADPDVRVYDSPGQIMACCFDPGKALCRKGSTGQSNSGTPDLTACDSRCANIARTDQHIDVLHQQVTDLEDECASDLTPEPIRHRLQAQLERHRVIIAAHEQAGTP